MTGRRRGVPPRRPVVDDAECPLNLDCPVGAVAGQSNRDESGGGVRLAYPVTEEPNGGNVTGVLTRRNLFRFDALRIPRKTLAALQVPSLGRNKFEQEDNKNELWQIS